MLGFLALPERTIEPRESGFTHVLDKGGRVEQVCHSLDIDGGYVGVVKLVWGPPR